MNLLVNFFEGCKEQIMGKETEGRGSTARLDYWVLSQDRRNTLSWHKLLNF